MRPQVQYPLYGVAGAGAESTGGHGERRRRRCGIALSVGNRSRRDLERMGFRFLGLTTYACCNEMLFLTSLELLLGYGGAVSSLDRLARTDHQPHASTVIPTAAVRRVTSSRRRGTSQSLDNVKAG